MPSDRIRVEHVDSTPTRKPGVTQHVITAEDERGLTRQYETVNDFRASLCARWKNRWITVVWKDSRWGRELVDVVNDLEAA